jgi:hypothetical protein
MSTMLASEASAEFESLQRAFAAAGSEGGVVTSATLPMHALCRR